MLKASVATAEDLQRKLAEKIETMKKEVSQLLQIAAQSRKQIQELLSSAEKRLGEFTNSKDPSDEDFIQVARYLDKTKNILVLILSKSAGDRVTTTDASDKDDDDIIQVVLSDSQKILLNHLNRKLRSIFQHFEAEEKELSGIEEEISEIITEMSQLVASIKEFTGTRNDQFCSYSQKRRELFEVELRLENVGFRLLGVSSTMENLKKFHPEEVKKAEAVENSPELVCEEAEKEIITGGEKSLTSGLNIQEGSARTNLTEEVSYLTSALEEVSSVPEMEEGLSSRPEDPKTEVSPRPPERPVATTTTTSVPVPVHSSVQSQQMKKIKQLQVENLKKDLSVFGSFSLSPGSYSSFNVFYVEGTPGKFWLSIDNGALTEFNFLIKVFIKKKCFSFI